MIIATTAKIQPFVWIYRLTLDAADKFRHFSQLRPPATLNSGWSLSSLAKSSQPNSGFFSV